ncbi:MAG: hypothetical protein KAJ03_05135 [Gammaproteobacteria bacterium]|nr:hypothetical protein [Gammaproteobacteria bacterium]
MNTTKLLCRTFDRRKKGYVEWGDVFDALPYAIAAVVMVTTYLYGGYALFALYHNGLDYTSSLIDAVRDMCVFWFIGMSAMLCVFIPLIVLETLKDKYKHKRIVTRKKEK